MRDGGGRTLLWRTGIAALVAVGLLALPDQAQAQRDHFQLKLGAMYDQGDFGTSETTRTGFLPVTFKYLGEKFDVGVTLALVSIDSPGGITFVETSPTEVTTTRGARQHNTGFGDIFLKGRYFAVDDGGAGSWIPALTPFVKLKIPTADESRNLGTGEVDYGFGLEVDKTFGRFIVFGDVSYTIVGDIPGQSLRDRPAASLGVGVKLTDAVTVLGFLDWRRALIRGNDDPLELVGVVSFKVTPAITVSPNAFVGLTDGSPDFGIGVEVSYKFGRW